MRATAYCFFIRYRSWTTDGKVFDTIDQRLAALRNIVAENDLDDDVPKDPTENDLVDILGEHDHEVHLFDGPITIPIRELKKRTSRKGRTLHHHAGSGRRAS